MKTLPAILAALFLLTSCSAYRAGWPGDPAVRTVRIEPVENASRLAQITPLLSRALRDAFLRDGTVRLANAGAPADATLAATVIAYDQQRLSHRPEDTGRALSARVTLTVEVIWAVAGAEPVRYTLTEESTVYTEPNLADSTYQALPELAERISRAIRDRVLAPWPD